MPWGWHCPAARVALGPTAGRHSEVGHEGSAAAPSCPLHRGGQGLAEPGLHQQPEPGTAGTLEPCRRDTGTALQGPGRRVAPLTPTGGGQGAHQGPDPTGWWVLPQSVGARLRACTHTQHGPWLRCTVRRGSAEQRQLWARARLSSPSHHRVLDLGAQAHPGSLAGGRHLHEAVTHVERPLL